MYRLLIMLLLWSLLPIAAQDLGGMFGGDDGGEFQLDEEPYRDYEKLPFTHFSELADWPGTAPAVLRRYEGELDAWRVTAVPGHGERRFVWPVGDQPIANVMNVPADGKYRFWLGYLGETKAAHPVEVTLGGANELIHSFGATKLPNELGSEIEKRLPIRFDSEIGRMAVQTVPVVVWEYLDVELKAGTTMIAVHSTDKTARVDAIFITQSKTFVPSKSPVEDEGNLIHTYYRWRLVDPPAGVEAVKMDSFVRYVWAHYRKGDNLKRIYYSSMGTIKSEKGELAIPVNEWSAWNDVDEQVVNAGSYFTDTLTVTNAANDQKLDSGTVEIQLAWFRDPGAVLRTTYNEIANGWCRYLVPVATVDGYVTAASPEGDTAGVWGARAPAYIAQFLSERGAIEQLLTMVEAEAELLPGTMPQRIGVFTTCRTASPAFDAAIALLKRAGINLIPHLPFAVKQKHGLRLEDMLYEQSGTIVMHSHDPLDPVYESELLRQNYGLEAMAKRIEADPDYLSRPHWLKMGDEIGPVTSATHVNGLPDDLAAFRDYLRGIAAELGVDASYFGATSFDDLYYNVERQPNLSLAQRRLFYHSRYFTWYFTSQFYERHTNAAMTHLPNLRTRCNYTPGGPMFAGTMDRSNWFALPRFGGSSAHSAEDWLSSGNSYTSMAGVQTESYYGALVRCGANLGTMEMDFIMVGNSGSLDRKLPILVGSGIHMVYVYDWGPVYTFGASDCWSHRVGAYTELNRACRALGPAEDLLLDGRPDPPRVALLYNRTHELWHDGDYGLFSDRLYTWLALRQEHFPTELLLEEDLTPDILARFQVLYVNGFNVRREVIPVLRAWVEAGGTLVASGGFGQRDEYDQPMPEAVDLLGASQRPAGVSEGGWMPFYIVDHQPIGTVKLDASPLTEPLQADVVGLRLALTPTTGKPVATYEDGSCAGVYRELGQGRVLTLGVMAGLIYANNAPRDEAGKPTTYQPERRRLIALPALRHADPPAVTYSEPLAEIYYREHADGIAIILVDFSYQPGKPATLAVRTDRDIREVSGTLAGSLTWRRDGDRILIDCPTPQASDVIVLK